jgi:hypothetical protein
MVKKTGKKERVTGSLTGHAFEWTLQGSDYAVST